MDINSLKVTIEKAQMHDNIIENIQNYDKDLKGYMYDSLVHRYQLALEQAVKTRTKKHIALGRFHNFGKAEAYVQTKENMRDLMSFCVILNQVIGEHT